MSPSDNTLLLILFYKQKNFRLKKSIKQKLTISLLLEACHYLGLESNLGYSPL